MVFRTPARLARTATNIKVGAVSPLAGVFKFALKLMLAVYLARWLEIVPMACIGGILMFVAVNMVKPAEVREVWNHNRFHAVLMIYTAVMVPVTDFLIGVLSALALYGVLYRFFDTPRSPHRTWPMCLTSIRPPRKPNHYELNSVKHHEHFRAAPRRRVAHGAGPKLVGVCAVLQDGLHGAIWISCTLPVRTSAITRAFA